MCGICGIADSHGNAPDGPSLARMSDCMRHRGPDDQGTSRSRDGSVAFGHQRLAIIDLSAAGHQPMRDQSGRYTIVLNGEIYNYVAIRETLRSAGVHFTTATDTEVLLEAYRAWGPDCLERLNGMFAFALHDAATRTLFCARDRAGEKPFYYRHAGWAARVCLRAEGSPVPPWISPRGGRFGTGSLSRVRPCRWRRMHDSRRPKAARRPRDAV